MRENAVLSHPEIESLPAADLQAAVVAVGVEAGILTRAEQALGYKAPGKLRANTVDNLQALLKLAEEVGAPVYRTADVDGYKRTRVNGWNRLQALEKERTNTVTRLQSLETDGIWAIGVIAATVLGLYRGSWWFFLGVLALTGITWHFMRQRERARKEASLRPKIVAIDEELTKLRNFFQKFSAQLRAEEERSGRQFVVTGEIVWLTSPLEEFHEGVPAPSLDLALQMKERNQEVRFEVEYAVLEIKKERRPYPDPFLIARLGDARLYISVWDEPQFAASPI